MLLHWQVNFAPGFVVGSKEKKGQAKRDRESKPLYTHSLDE